jgi:mannose-6-phosphate isomerase-like protein (cupin superfamily)
VGALVSLADDLRFEPRFVDKPWGSELIWALSEVYCGKILTVDPGESLSLQYHELKDESWYVLEGVATLELGTSDTELETSEIRVGDAFRYTPGTRHRVTAIETLRILEVSTPHLDDVVRVEDRYGRA